MVKTPSERVRDSLAKTIESGGRRVVAVLQPDAAQALEDLTRNEYAASATACISRALIETAARRKKRKTK